MEKRRERLRGKHRTPGRALNPRSLLRALKEAALAIFDNLF
jgi:hypothetical protein